MKRFCICVTFADNFDPWMPYLCTNNSSFMSLLGLEMFLGENPHLFLKTKNQIYYLPNYFRRNALSQLPPFSSRI